MSFIEDTIKLFESKGVKGWTIEQEREIRYAIHLEEKHEETQSLELGIAIAEYNGQNMTQYEIQGYSTDMRSYEQGFAIGRVQLTHQATDAFNMYTNMNTKIKAILA